MSAPDRQSILRAIDQNLEIAEQWKECPYKVEWVARVASYSFKAEALIELLEVHDCGSVGGFDKGQEFPGSDLKKRYVWLKNKD